MRQLPYIQQRIFNTPLIIAPREAENVLSVLSGGLGVSALLNPSGNVLYGADQNIDMHGGADTEFKYKVHGDVAIIPVTGTLVHKSSWINALCGMTSYSSIRDQFYKALSDPKVKKIAFDIDSGGGEVSGCFDLVDSIYAERGNKPIMAILSECAFSAAYAIASACDTICVPRTGGTGSVGVVAMHVDMSKRLETEGMKVTMIHYGEKKIDGNETQPLSSAALKRLQTEVNKMGELFVKTVARNRGLKAKVVRDTEAGIFMGKAGVDIGFADAVLSPHDAFEILNQNLA